MEEIKKKLFAAEDAHKEWFEEISRTVFQHPELGDQEFFSSQYLADEMRKAASGWKSPTAVWRPRSAVSSAEAGEGPTVAFLAEYDALPGYGPNGDQNGHACGHNWIAASTFAACEALKELKEQVASPAESSIWVRRRRRPPAGRSP